MLLLLLSNELLLVSIAKFLDFKAIHRFRLVSKNILFKALLQEEFLTKSHPHAVVHISRWIMRERINNNIAPRPSWMRQIIRDPLHLVRYEDLDEENSGQLVLFSSDVNDDGKSLAVRVSYVSQVEGFSTLEAFIEATITPSHSNPLRRGVVSIRQEFHTTTTTTTKQTTRHLVMEEEYADGFDPREALERWCPLEAPDHHHNIDDNDNDNNNM